MTQILKRSAPVLDIRVGQQARELILKEGLQAQHVDIIPGAAGGPKGIGIQGLDQAIFGDFLTRAPKRRTLIGSSIGSWRFASIAGHGAIQGTNLLGDLYTHLEFHKKMTRHEVGQVCREMLHQLVQGHEQNIVQHPDYHLTVLAVKSENIFKSDRTLALLASVLGIIASNAIARPKMKTFVERVIAQPDSSSQFKIIDDGFKTHYCNIHPENLEDWLMASASIPVAVPAVRGIVDAPEGAYRDGGLIDYHIDLPFQSQGIVLYPHFTDSITPGWFDKMFKSRKSNPHNQARTVLISPSQEYLKSLPFGRLPDRKDFTLKGLDQQQRIAMWKQSINESQRLGDAFLELVEKQSFESVMQDL